MIHCTISSSLTRCLTTWTIRSHQPCKTYFRHIKKGDNQTRNAPSTLTQELTFKTSINSKNTPARVFPAKKSPVVTNAIRQTVISSSDVQKCEPELGVHKGKRRFKRGPNIFEVIEETRAKGTGYAGIN